MGLDTTILTELEGGLSPIQISKKLNIPKQTVSYNVAKLQKLGLVKKVSYGVWEVIKRSPTIPREGKVGNIGLLIKEVRGHAFIWRIEFLKAVNWDVKIKNYLKSSKKKLTFQIMGAGKGFYRTMFNNRKVWLTMKGEKAGMVIYEPLSFLGRSSVEAKATAVFEMDKLIKDLFEAINLPLVPYRFTTSREHYALIRNALARQYNDRGEKLEVKDENGTAWLWIDDSHNLGELETNEVTSNRKVQIHFNHIKATPLEVLKDFTPQFLLNSIGAATEQARQNSEQLGDYAKHLKAHVESVKQLGTAVQELTSLVKELKK